MAYEWARTGTKCVCIDPANELKMDAVYTVRQLGDGFGPEMLSLMELDPFRSWYAWRFRPLIAQADDVEMFLRLANPSPLERLDLLAERMNELASD